MKRVLIMILTALLALPAWAQEDAMKDLPGYVDFGQLGEIFGEPSVQIAVGQSLLNMVSALSSSEDPEAAELFKRLQGVRIQVFETAGLTEGATDHVKRVGSALSAQGWESVVTVNSPEEQVRIFMKINGDMVEGITVMAVEEDEAAFINVIGNLNPAELEKVMDNFDMEIGDDNDGEED
jgi:phosphoglycolate phosphatase-like HAD superfamily hydrolase